MKKEEIESSLFLSPYVSKEKGLGGNIKHIPEDFTVGEILENNQVLDPEKMHFELPGKTGLFLHFVLWKKDIEANRALDLVARYWSIPRENLGIAGTKDKRAVTAQRVSAWGARKLSEQGILSSINLPTIKTHSHCFKLTEVRLGNLWGNAFDITIRNVKYGEENINEIFSHISRDIEEFGGLPNSFGIQRFGDIRPITHIVGKHVILGNLKEAFRHYIGMVFKGEPEETKKARKFYWETENNKGSLELFPHYLFLERKMLHDLEKRNNNYENVFYTLPLQLRKLFIHAYQAFLFNNYVIIRYNHYSSDFTKPLNGEEMIKEKVYIPIVGSKTTLKGETSDIYSKIFEKENITLTQFKTQLIQKIGGKGARRSLLFTPQDLKLKKIEEDDFNKKRNKINLTFKLQKGSYATNFLRELMK